jgi:hypothetical protein
MLTAADISPAPSSSQPQNQSTNPNSGNVFDPEFGIRVRFLSNFLNFHYKNRLFLAIQKFPWR